MRLGQSNIKYVLSQLEVMGQNPDHTIVTGNFMLDFRWVIKTNHCQWKCSPKAICFYIYMVVGFFFFFPAKAILKQNLISSKLCLSVWLSAVCQFTFPANANVKAERKHLRKSSYWGKAELLTYRTEVIDLVTEILLWH